jgi:drug/metabolite transporter (DMT)-like permease
LAVRSDSRPQQVGITFGLAAAITFGASTPFAKRLLDDVTPQLLAGLLYLGAFGVLFTVVISRRVSNETPLRREDAPRLVAVILSGGVLAPVLLLVGLERVSGASGSLLLNLEGPFTVLIGIMVFREHLGRFGIAGAAAVFVGAMVLSLGSARGSTDIVGVACVVGACALWGVDNNLTQSLTLRDPWQIVTAKAGVAGTVNVVLALVVGDTLPGAGVVIAACVLGAISYGLSVVFDAYALRFLGAAREAVIFASAPFVGALLAVPVLSETLGWREVLAGAVMAVGITLMVRERHDHSHEHAAFTHEHVHIHDAHHQHEHPAGIDPKEPHSHVHEHEPLVHAHPHVSDLHHRHSHGSDHHG